MAIIYEYKGLPGDGPDAVVSAQQWAEEIVPLFQEYWGKFGEKIYGRPFQFNVLAFIMHAIAGGYEIIVAKDTETKQVVGFMLCVAFTPMAYRSRIIQIEKWYAIDEQIEKGLFDKLNELLPALKVSEVWITDSVVGIPHMNWKKKREFVITHYVRD